MGLFYTRQSNIAAAVRPRLRAAHLANSVAPAAADTATDQDTTAIEQATRPTFSVPRFVCAFILVLVLFGLYVWSAHDTTMAAHSDALFTLFETLASGLTGVLVGESASNTWPFVSDDTVSVVWGTGGSSRTDRITLLPDGNSIFVDSPWGGGIKFTGTRRGGE